MDILAYLAGMEQIPKSSMEIRSEQTAWDWLTNPGMTVGNIFNEGRYIKVPVAKDAYVICEVNIRHGIGRFGYAKVEAKAVLLYDAQSELYTELCYSMLASWLCQRQEIIGPVKEWDYRSLREPIMQVLTDAVCKKGPCWDVPVKRLLFWTDEDARQIVFDMVCADDPQSALQTFYIQERMKTLAEATLNDWALANMTDILRAMRDPEIFIAQTAREILKSENAYILTVRQAMAMLLAATEEVNSKPEHPWHQWGAVCHALEAVNGKNVCVQCAGDVLKLDSGKLMQACRNGRGYLDAQIQGKWIRIQICDIEKISYGRKVLYEKVS